MSAAVLAVLLAWQFSAPVVLERASLAQRAAAEMRQVVEQRDDVLLVEADAHFTRASASERKTLLGTVYVQRRPVTTAPDAALSADLTQAIQRRLLAEWPTLTPLVSATVLDPPPADPRSIVIMLPAPNFLPRPAYPVVRHRGVRLIAGG